MKIHFIGIGGIGVSALAIYYLAKGHQVTGSDLTETEITKALKAKGAKISIGPHTAQNVPAKVSMVIYSPAIPPTNLELQHAHNMGPLRNSKSRWERGPSFAASRAQIFSYPQALGELTKNYYTIAVAGTHGKSTTTAMIALVLAKAGLDPTVIVGTKIKEFDPSAGGSNCRVGTDKYLVKRWPFEKTEGKPILVIEADEHFASFLHYYPHIIVLTTIEADHLDYYKNLKNIMRAFKLFIKNLQKGGIVIANKDDANAAKIASSTKGHTTAKYYSNKFITAQKIRPILKVPGEYNVSNAHAAFMVAKVLQIPDKKTLSILSQFQGTWRRFEIFRLTKPPSTSSGQARPYTLVSDYGHHPTEVKLTVEAARSKWPKKKIWLVFQPHQYQRTHYFFRAFIRILATLPIDRLIVTDIYDVAGRETKEISEKVSSEILVKKIKHTTYKVPPIIMHIPTLNEAEQYLNDNLQGNEVVMIMGAGDIYDLTLRLLRLHSGQVRSG